MIEVKIEPLGIENRKIECHMSFLKLLQNTCSKLIGTLRRKMSFFCTILVIVLDNFSYKIRRVARALPRAPGKINCRLYPNGYFQLIHYQSSQVDSPPRFEFKELGFGELNFFHQ